MIGENATLINIRFVHVFIKLTLPRTLLYRLQRQKMRAFNRLWPKNVQVLLCGFLLYLYNNRSITCINPMIIVSEGIPENINPKPSVQNRACEVQRPMVNIFGIAPRKQLLYGLLQDKSYWCTMFERGRSSQNKTTKFSCSKHLISIFCIL